MPGALLQLVEGRPENDTGGICIVLIDSLIAKGIASCWQRAPVTDVVANRCS